VKAYFLIAFLLFFLTTSTFSQILVGPVAGANYSWTSFRDEDLKDAYGMSPVFGFHVGGHLAFKVQKRFFLHTSLVYASKGRNLTGELDTKLRNKARYNYIDMPISYTVDFKGKIGNSKEFKYFIGIGPNVSYWLNGNGTLYNSDFEENNLGELSYKIAFKKLPDSQKPDEMTIEDPNRFQLGLNFVAGVVLEPAPRQRVMVSIRYELGHSYLGKTNGIFQNTYFQDPLQSRNQGFRVSLAYLIDLKVEDRKKGKSTIDKKRPK
jgi:Outer membrane protein beta-barrel domain